MEPSAIIAHGCGGMFYRYWHEGEGTLGGKGVYFSSELDGDALAFVACDVFFVVGLWAEILEFGKDV